MKHDYYGVQKVKWDQMWHALRTSQDYYSKKYYETYDRITKKEAMRIIDELDKDAMRIINKLDKEQDGVNYEEKQI